MIDRRAFSFPAILVLSLFSLFTFSCTRKSLEGKFLITEVPGLTGIVNTTTGDNWRFIPGARIVAVDSLAKNPEILLTKNFYSACSPELSSDGKHMLFTAQQKKGDSWQIWDMDLVNLTSRKITSDTANCTDGVYLPDGRVAYSKYQADSVVKTSYSLFVCKADGSDERQITFHPYANFGTTVLKDGRLLTITKQIRTSGQSRQMFMVVRPDGTKADLFYKGEKGSQLLSRARETGDHKLFFIESDSIHQGKSSIICISYSRPLHSRINVSQEVKGSFLSVIPLESGKVLVTYRPADNVPYELYEFDPMKKALGKKIYGKPGYSMVEAVVVQKTELPKKLPSEVDMGVKTGLLLCQDINFNLPLPGETLVNTKASKIEILGTESSMGTVEVEPDGSFYLKILADKPFQIRTLDAGGHVVKGPSAWIWLRPNERRGCIGCHENRELAPENNVPLSVRKAPVSVPVHVAKIGEKDIELE